MQSQHQISLAVRFQAVPIEIKGIEYNYDKPVIYFYPEKEQQIDVKLKVAGKLGFTYPTYNNGWSFKANPNGLLRTNNSTYRYLFWEAKIPAQHSVFNQKTGFLVSSDSLLSFFERTLSKIGLSSSEQQDFITFWYPLMKNNTTNYIHFIFNDEYDKIASLDVTPKPESTIRLFMFWKKVEDNSIINIPQQNIPSYTRKGFTVVEWGGSEIPCENFNLSDK